MKESNLLTIFLFLLCGSMYAQPRTFKVFVHDPVMIKEKGTYYIFCTGQGVNILKSTDRIHWETAGHVFNKNRLPAWHKDDIPEQDGHLWAPDIHYRNGLYHLYYSVSAWMNFNSSIGYATNKTLDPDSPDYQWIDHGKIIDFRNGGKGVNCIDPNIFVDDDGTVWLLYGSYKAGLRLVELNPENGKLKNEAHPNIITLTTSLGEGVFLIKRDGYYYIFASRGTCCKGLDSNYHVVMGRSKNIHGPYLNKAGESWVENKFTLFMEGNEQQPGRGHNGFFCENDTTFIVYHGYDRSVDGASLLNIAPVHKEEDGWPTLTPSLPIFPTK